MITASYDVNVLDLPSNKDVITSYSVEVLDLPNNKDVSCSYDIDIQPSLKEVETLSTSTTQNKEHSFENGMIVGVIIGRNSKGF